MPATLKKLSDIYEAAFFNLDTNEYVIVVPNSDDDWYVYISKGSEMPLAMITCEYKDKNTKVIAEHDYAFPPDSKNVQIMFYTSINTVDDDLDGWEDICYRPTEGEDVSIFLGVK